MTGAGNMLRLRYEHPAPIPAPDSARSWYVYSAEGRRVYNRTSLFGGWHTLADALAFALALIRQHDAG